MHEVDSRDKFTRCTRGERAQLSMGMLDPIHKPKLPMAKAALVGGAGTGSAPVSATRVVRAMPLGSSKPGPLLVFFLPPAAFDLLSFTTSGPKFGTSH